MTEPRVLFLGLVGVAPDPHLAFGWRLIGPNNRELGRCTRHFPSVDEAADSVHELIASLSRAELDHVRVERGSVWRWWLLADGRAWASAARGFRRERECRYSGETFVQELPRAILRLPDDPQRLPHVRLSTFVAVRPSDSLAIPLPRGAAREVTL